MSFVVIIGILVFVAGVIGAVRYVRSNRALALAYTGLVAYSVGLMLLWASYTYGVSSDSGDVPNAFWIRANNGAGWNLLLELAWLAILVTGVLLLLALREYTRRRVTKAIASRETVDRLDLIPPRRRRRRRRRRSRRKSGSASAGVPESSEDADEEENED